MNILELCLSPSYGGLELHMRDFSFWLSKKSECTLYIATRNDSRLYKALVTLNVPMINYPSKAGKLPFFKALKLAKFIEKTAIDIVHVHWKNDLPLVALAKRMSNRPFKFVHTRHMSLPGKKFDPYHRFIYGSMDCFIAANQFMARQAETNLPISKDKIQQIYHGVDAPPNVDSDSISRLKKKFSIHGEFVVGLMGRITDFKGQHLLLYAIDKLRVEGINISAIIVGEQFDPRYLDKLKTIVVERNLAKQVQFLDFHSRPNELMSCFDALVLTTKLETFGLVLIEAMHSGIPVIGSNAGGVPEIIDNEVTGLLFESWNANSLAEALKRLYTDREFGNKIAIMGRQKAQKIFDAKIQYQKVFQTMCGGKSISAH
jgi:glycosyltransferase involved in cell wall biosynthesis